MQVNIKPVPQARPRFYTRKEGFRRITGAYDTARCKTFKEVIAWHALIKARETGLNSPLESPISISVVFKMGNHKRKEVIHHTKKPDIDNLAKAVKDALKGIIYRDDSQIVEAHLYKQYGEQGIEIQINELKGSGGSK